MNGRWRKFKRLGELFILLGLAGLSLYCQRAFGADSVSRNLGVCVPYREMVLRRLTIILRGNAFASTTQSQKLAVVL